MKDSVAGIDYRFNNSALLDEALTHRSMGAFNNERLEFLGDSLLGAIVSSLLYRRFPAANEGDLTRMRARLVRRSSLASLATKLELGRALRMDSGVLKSGGVHNASILADALEAVLGAVYLDGGFDACREVIRTHFEPLIEALPEPDALKDPKTRLQEWLQARARPLPVYELEDESGPAHDKTFSVSCELDDGERTDAEGSSRGGAEQTAAAAMLKLLEESGR